MRSTFREIAKREIDRHSVISFDVFDTLLLRPYVSPGDLFRHVEVCEEAESFEKERRDAESRAYKKNQDGDCINFDDIYAEIDEKFRHLKDVEASMEEKVIRANEEMRMLFEYALYKNKTVVIASEMYLPGDLIERILSKNGYTGYSKLFVSSDLRASKWTGRLYDAIISYTRVDPREILHIGDNPTADVKRSRSKGMTALLYEKVIDRFLSCNRYAKRFRSLMKNDLEASILLGVTAMHWNTKVVNGNEDYWTDFGYRYGGAVCAGYMRFISKKASEEKCDVVAFVSRDGYTLEKLFTPSGSVKKSYIHAQRTINLLTSLKYKDEKEARHIVDFFGKENDVVRALSEKKLTASAMIDSERELFERLAEEARGNYASYMRNILGDPDKIMLTDLITTTFSAQRALHDTIDAKIHGCYFSVRGNEKNDEYEHSVYHPVRSDDSVRRIVPYLELLLTSPQLPLAGISKEGHPVYADNIDPHERFWASVYPSISEGIIKFSNDLNDIFGEHAPSFRNDIVTKWLNIQTNLPSDDDIENLSKVRWTFEATHTEYYPLMQNPVKRIIRNAFGDLVDLVKFKRYL